MYRVIPVLFIVSLLAACSSPMPTATAIAIATAAPTPKVTTASDSLAPAGPAWLSTPLTDARTNKPFTLASYAGKTVVVEAMAAWCTTCLAQQRQVIEARKVLGYSVIYISLNVDPNQNAAGLAQYAADNGFDWTFAMGSTEAIEQLIAQYGRTITNPPSVPLFIINPVGKPSELVTGGHSADDLVKLIKQYSAL